MDGGRAGTPGTPKDPSALPPRVRHVGSSRAPMTDYARIPTRAYPSWPEEVTVKRQERRCDTMFGREGRTRVLCCLAGEGRGRFFSGVLSRWPGGYTTTSLRCPFGGAEVFTEVGAGPLFLGK